jgi:serine/threonine protein kinase
LQIGVSVDIYSLAVILFELFSGTDPFPGNIGQIYQAKFQNEKPNIPFEFPEALKNVICDGWSKKPRERPEIEKFRSALNVLKQEEETTQRGKVQMTINIFLYKLYGNRWSTYALYGSTSPAPPPFLCQPAQI